jgi:hypothetical protein
LACQREKARQGRLDPGRAKKLCALGVKFDFKQLETLEDTTARGKKAALPVVDIDSLEGGADRDAMVPLANDKNHLPRYPIGLPFVKHFEGRGALEGRITAFDGQHYKVFYPGDDGSEEELSEWEFEPNEGVEISRIPVSRADHIASSMPSGLKTMPTPTWKSRGRGQTENEELEGCEPPRKRKRPESRIHRDESEEHSPRPHVMCNSSSYLYCFHE